MDWFRKQMRYIASARAAGGPTSSADGANQPARRLPGWARGLLALLAVPVLYYGAGALLIDARDPDLAIRPGPARLPAGGSVLAATAGELLMREVHEHRWTPNDSMLAPSALLESMPAWQTGIHGAIDATVVALMGVKADPDLGEAVEKLATPPEQGRFSLSWPPVRQPAERAYDDAVAALETWNRKVADDAADYDRNGRIFIQVSRALADELDRAAALTGRQIDNGPDGDAAAAYEQARGAAYAAAVLVRALRYDHAELIRERQLGDSVSEVTALLDEMVQERPWRIGRTDLVSQGYFLLRVRSMLRTLAAQVPE